LDHFTKELRKTGEMLDSTEGFRRQVDQDQDEAINRKIMELQGFMGHSAPPLMGGKFLQKQWVFARTAGRFCGK
jgi:hypothetical protein